MGWNPMTGSRKHFKSKEESAPLRGRGNVPEVVRPPSTGLNSPQQEAGGLPATLPHVNYDRHDW